MNLSWSLELLADFYELTMSEGYLRNGREDSIVYFDLFYRRNPDEGGFAILAGVDHFLSILRDFHFTEEDLDYLRSLGKFSPEFLDYLRNLDMTKCTVWTMPEGTPVFPGEPLMTIRGPVIQAQLLETVALNCVNHESLIATKANRMVRAAEGRPVVEFGARRAHGASAAVWGARAAYIGGCVGTSCTLAGQRFGIPVSGTMAHSWVQLFDSELEAFKAYARTYPDDCVLLVDTYDVLKHGIPNAIRTFNEVVLPAGYRPKGIRIDSGDLAYLSKRARAMLDEAGFPDCKIVASNALDEYIVRDLLRQGAPVDIFGIGERLITSKSDPVFGGVYKLVAVEDAQGVIHPKIKVSENTAKTTNPGFKQVFRFFDNETNHAIADVIALRSETIDPSQDYELFDPIETWKTKMLRGGTYSVKPLLEKRTPLEPSNGAPANPEEAKKRCAAELELFWDEVKRFENPHRFYVDLSHELWTLRQRLIHAAK
ncbi:MAG TPA: nicotinate phosphoribosyltransferase [Firmicutes bacterium]|nr:nicotinate phosphoribosyltransferase [Candidatus Fermentithermobacillaceae bacterium]